MIIIIIIIVGHYYYHYIHYIYIYICIHIHIYIYIINSSLPAVYPRELGRPFLAVVRLKKRRLRFLKSPTRPRDVREMLFRTTGAWSALHQIPMGSIRRVHRALRRVTLPSCHPAILPSCHPAILPSWTLQNDVDGYLNIEFMQEYKKTQKKLRICC